jgi:hypothetical protein
MPRSFGDLGAATNLAGPERKRGPKKRWVAAALVMVTAVAACVFSTREKPRIEWVVADAHQIAVNSEIFESTKPLGVKYTDSWQTEEYALFRADGRQLEMIYAQASEAFTVALDYQMPIEKMVSTWNLNSRQNLVWGPLGRVDTRLGTWFYRTYAHNALQRSCAGLMVEWDQIYEDPQGRPRKVAFGYFCRAEGETLEDEAVRALIRGIRIGTTEGRSTRRYTANDTTEDKGADLMVNEGLQNASAIAVARGYNLSTDIGIPRFPFMFAGYYSESGGGKIH